MLCRKKPFSSCHSSIEHLALAPKSSEYREEVVSPTRDIDETSTLIGDDTESVGDDDDICEVVYNEDEDSEVCHIINNPQEFLYTNKSITS